MKREEIAALLRKGGEYGSAAKVENMRCGMCEHYFSFECPLSMVRGNADLYMNRGPDFGCFSYTNQR